MAQAGVGVCSWSPSLLVNRRTGLVSLNLTLKTCVCKRERGGGVGGSGRLGLTYIYIIDTMYKIDS